MEACLTVPAPVIHPQVPVLCLAPIPFYFPSSIPGIFPDVPFPRVSSTGLDHTPRQGLHLPGSGKRGVSRLPTTLSPCQAHPTRLVVLGSVNDVSLPVTQVLAHVY